MATESAAVKPSTIGAWRRVAGPGAADRGVKDEMRCNLLRKLEARETLFPGICGYEETVLPQIANAILARHNFILLGLRGQAKSRNHPLRPICRACREIVAERGDETPIAWLSREERFVEKLATPDVTIADIIGDVDPIKAARGGRDLSDELTIHYGLLPRANRGIFAINELPDLAGKIQVGLFNIMQEGDVQIKGYPIRLPLDVLLVFTANPEDYTARGKIITPLKDRVGSEIRTHYPATVEEGMAITAQEAWVQRIPAASCTCRITFAKSSSRSLSSRATISASTTAPASASACPSPRSRPSSAAPSSAPRAMAKSTSARASDVYAAIPAMTGKMELEYEGELKGADPIARELIRAAVGKVYTKYIGDANLQPVVQWFENGGDLKMPENATATEQLAALRRIPGLLDHIERLGANGKDPASAAAAAEFILEGLWAHKRISRNEERGFFAERPKPVEPREPFNRPPRRQYN